MLETSATFVQFDAIEEGALASLNGPGSPDERLQAVCDLLKEKVPHYHWVGFYLTDPETGCDLVLGPFSGAPTEHVRIPFGRGICGQAASSGRTFLVQDVSEEANYLSCSVHVKSEIVVPVLRDGRVLGELDIDSHDTAPFSERDSRFLEKLCQHVAQAI